MGVYINRVFIDGNFNAWVRRDAYNSIFFAHHVYGEPYMKRAIKPLKYILLFKGCFIAFVLVFSMLAYSLCWGVSLMGQQAEHGKQYIYAKAQDAVVAVGSRLGVIATEEEQQAAVEQQVYAVLSKEEQNTITENAFNEMEAGVKKPPVKKQKPRPEYTNADRAAMNNLTAGVN